MAPATTPLEIRGLPLITKTYCGATPAGFHQIAYREYGDKKNPCIIAVHGLTRNAYDFHALGCQLQGEYRFIAVDMPGRGQSDPLRDPAYYTYYQYANDLISLISRLDVTECYWVGTSMGGLLGMILASLPGSPIRKLILNDIGPFVSHDVIQRIRRYAGVEVKTPTRAELEAIAHEIYAPFGPISQENWRKVMDHNIRELEDGTFTFAYDCRVTQQFDTELSTAQNTDPKGNLTFWPYWDALTCDVMVIHGAQSDLLTRSILDKMASRGPQFHYHCVKEAGHAPWLLDPSLLDEIHRWLNRSPNHE